MDEDRRTVSKNVCLHGSAIVMAAGFSDFGHA